MSWWVLGATANAVVAVAYILISVAIVVPLVRSGQIRANPLGAATAAIFFTCAVHHGSHTVHMVLPYVGADLEHGLALRSAFDWHQATWDVVSAVVGVYYWTLRRSYASLMGGPALFEDLRRREQQALQLNDTVLQGLVVAKMALDMDQKERSQEALEGALAAASGIITNLLRNGSDGTVAPGRLVRRDAAVTGRGA